MNKAQVFQINVSQGGVPKSAVRAAEISELGVAGDKQQDRKHHGGPERAVSLYSLERILALQAEGHPIYPGSAGENVTIAGLDWELVQPGVVLALGDEVRLQVTSFVVPCSNIRHSFIDEKFTRISEKLYSGWSRAYARVLQTGSIKIGDEVRLESAAPAHVGVRSPQDVKSPIEE